MTDARQDAIDTLHEVADALSEAQSALRVAEVQARKALRRKDGGVPAAETLRANPVVRHRPQVDEALNHLERVRHRMLLRVFEVALEDGMTIGELARNYGFSRQLASRYAKEARATSRSFKGSPDATRHLAG
jgi:DNA invertase Pin-like site-specific DNA recombinase